MNKEQFNAIFPNIIQDLVSLLMEKQNLDFENALVVLYDSELFEKLSEEETKFWYFSTEKLYEMWEYEQKTGKTMSVDYL
ncbi:hypothetical protein [Kaistella sp.]|uniref:hypothetical protein n=1 Tax=Kaistella sp. TaxID=2782235 RepID=UPI003C471568